LTVEPLTKGRAAASSVGTSCEQQPCRPIARHGAWCRTCIANGEPAEWL